MTSVKLFSWGACCVGFWSLNICGFGCLFVGVILFLTSILLLIIGAALSFFLIGVPMVFVALSIEVIAILMILVSPLCVLLSPFSCCSLLLPLFFKQRDNYGLKIIPYEEPHHHRSDDFKSEIQFKPSVVKVKNQEDSDEIIESPNFFPIKVEILDSLEDLNEFLFDGNFNTLKLDEFLLSMRYFQNFNARNAVILEYEDHDPSKELILVRSLKNYKYFKQGVTRLERNYYKKFYRIKESSTFFVKIRKYPIFPKTSAFVVYPLICPVRKRVFRLIVLSLERGLKHVNRHREIIENEENEKTTEFFAVYSKVQHVLTIRKKFVVYSLQALQWIIRKTEFRKIHFGFFYGDDDNPYKNVRWINGTTEENISQDSERKLLGRFSDDDTCVEDEYSKAYLVDPDVLISYGTDKHNFFGVLKISKVGEREFDERICWVNDDVVPLLMKILKGGSDIEIADRLKENVVFFNEDIGELDEGEISDEENDNEKKAEEYIIARSSFHTKRYFEALVDRYKGKLKKLSLKERKGMIDYSLPPYGVNAIIQSCLCLLGVSRKSLKEWNRSKTIMATKFRNNFAIIKDMQVSKIKNEKMIFVGKKIDEISFEKVNEHVNASVGTLYCFVEACVVYWKSMSKMKGVLDPEKLYQCEIDIEDTGLSI